LYKAQQVIQLERPNEMERQAVTVIHGYSHAGEGLAGLMENLFLYPLLLEEKRFVLQ